MGEVGPGTVIGGLRIDAVAGSGGMGVVYRATQLALQRTVAVKIVAPNLSDDPEFRERFKRESQLAASIDHPHVVPVYHAGEEDGRLFVTMRFVEGTDLRRQIRAGGPLNPQRAAEMVVQVAGALDAAHALGLVHRDVKPANILIAEGELVRAYLTDFGLAKQQTGPASGLTRAGVVMGTVDYVAPEQLQGGAVDGRADVYALGCVLFETLTGSVPFPRDSDAAKIWAHMGSPPPSLPDVAPHLPREFDEVLRRAMSKLPGDRYSSAGAFARAVTAAAAAPTPAAVPAARPLWAPASDSPPADPVTHGLSAVPTQRGPSNPSNPGGWPPAAARSVPAPRTSPGTRALPPRQPSYPDAHSADLNHPAGLSSPTGLQPQPRSRSRAGPIMLGALGALLVVALVAGLVVFGFGTTPRPAGEVVGVPLVTGPEPTDLAEGGGFLWTANTDTISKIDPRTGVSREITVGGAAYSLAVDRGAVWVHNADNSVVRVDIATEAVSNPIPTGGATIYSITAGGGYLWISHQDADLVSRLDMQTLQIVGTVSVAGGPGSVVFDSGMLYVVTVRDRTLSTIDGATGELVGTPLPVPGSGAGIRVLDGILYLGTTDSITPVEPTTRAVGRPLPLRGGAYFTVGARSLWVSYPTENAIRRLDLETGQERGEPIRGVGRDVATLEFSGGELHVVNGKTSTVTRIRPAP